MNTNPQNKIKMMLDMIADTTEDECDCETIDKLMEEVAELATQGVDLSVQMPDIEAHFERCGCCRQEFEVLKLILSSDA